MLLHYHPWWSILPVSDQIQCQYTCLWSYLLLIKLKRPITKLPLHYCKDIATITNVIADIAAILQIPFHITLQMLFPTHCCCRCVHICILLRSEAGTCAYCCIPRRGGCGGGSSKYPWQLYVRHGENQLAIWSTGIVHHPDCCCRIVGDHPPLLNFNALRALCGVTFLSSTWTEYNIIVLKLYRDTHR